ncbi:MAG: DNA-3-methyladenine glycosylase [bacterium]|nr:DNA-3-methyladenine glycosylase [bacterium]
MVIDRSFYHRNSILVARELLGMLFVHNSAEGLTSGIIVETEAYHQNDPASHTFAGKSQRNAVMFGPAGHAYIYFIYGMYYCFNISTGEEGVGEGVLIRALQPVEGVDLMKVRRRKDALIDQCNGPAKLVMAMGITPLMNGADLTDSTIFVESGDRNSLHEDTIVVTTRVGIVKAAEEPLRFYLKDNPYISKK